MAVKMVKPTTNNRRNMSFNSHSEVTKKSPEKSLTVKLSKIHGRNNQGRITVRHRGGGKKRHYRLVDFRLLGEVKAKVTAIEYDPNRSAHIALIQSEDGKKSYVIAAEGLKVGQTIEAGEKAEIRNANRMALKNIPVGTTIHNIEISKGKGGQLARSAGMSAQLVAKEGEFVQVKLPSGEVRLVHQDCLATIGNVGNAAHSNLTIGSAGRRRKMGFRPSVHGKAMNPVDHPMGGGEGKTGPGRHPRTPWGKPAIGLKTRRRKYTNNMIVKSRKARSR